MCYLYDLLCLNYLIVRLFYNPTIKEDQNKSGDEDINICYTNYYYYYSTILPVVTYTLKLSEYNTISSCLSKPNN